SLLCGTVDFIEKARRVRKMFGGGMRQVGVLAACGLIALESMIDRLADDHANARRLAEGIAELPGVGVDLDTVQTNMVYFETDRAVEIMERLAAERVRCLALGANRIRMVTHYDVDAEDVDAAVAALHRVTG